MPRQVIYINFVRNISKYFFFVMYLHYVSDIKLENQSMNIYCIYIFLNCVLLVPGTASAPSVALPSSPLARYWVDPSVSSSLSAHPSTPTPPQSQAVIGGSLRCSGWWIGPLTCGHPPLSAAPESTKWKKTHHVHMGQEIIYSGT